MHSLLRAALRAIGAPVEANAGIPGLKPVRPRETTAPAIEFEATLRHAGPLLQLAMLLAREAGLRHKAVMQLRLDNIDFEAHTICGRTKAWSTYNVPMSNRLEQKLLWACASLPNPEMPILQQFNRSMGKLGTTNISHKLRDAKKAAGLTSRWGMHDLRRTGARAIFQLTNDIKKVQRFLGHINPQHSWWYLGLEANELEQADIELASSTPLERDGAA
jgi:integrase